MTDFSDFETRLSMMFERVVAQVFEQPVQTEVGGQPRSSLVLIRGELEEGGPREDEDVDEGVVATLGPPHKSWRRRVFIGGVVVCGALVSAVGVAAATGDLSPQGTTQLAQQTLSPAISIVGSKQPGSVPGAVSRIDVPGPGGTVLNVYSDEGNDSPEAAANCVTLTINTPAGLPAPGADSTDSGGCTVVGVSSLGQQLPPSDHSLPYAGTQLKATWVSPTGVTYTIFFGDATAGASTVDLIGDDGEVKATLLTNDGWYAIYGVADQLGDSPLVFMSTTGRGITTKVH